MAGKVTQQLGIGPVGAGRVVKSDEGLKVCDEGGGASDIGSPVFLSHMVCRAISQPRARGHPCQLQSPSSGVAGPHRSPSSHAVSFRASLAEASPSPAPHRRS